MYMQKKKTRAAAIDTQSTWNSIPSLMQAFGRTRLFAYLNKHEHNIQLMSKRSKRRKQKRWTPYNRIDDWNSFFFFLPSPFRRIRYPHHIRHMCSCANDDAPLILFFLIYPHIAYTPHFYCSPRDRKKHEESITLQNYYHIRLNQFYFGCHLIRMFRTTENKMRQSYGERRKNAYRIIIMPKQKIKKKNMMNWTILF